MIDNICISFIKDWLYSASDDKAYTNIRLLSKQYGNLSTSDTKVTAYLYIAKTAVETIYYRITNNSATNHRAYAKFTTR